MRRVDISLYALLFLWFPITYDSPGSGLSFALPFDAAPGDKEKPYIEQDGCHRKTYDDSDPDRLWPEFGDDAEIPGKRKRDQPVG